MTESPSAQVSSGSPRSNNFLVIWQSSIAGLSYISGAAVLSDILPDRWAALFLVVVGGLSAGTAAYVSLAKPVETPVQVVTVDLHKP